MICSRGFFIFFIWILKITEKINFSRYIYFIFCLLLLISSVSISLTVADKMLSGLIPIFLSTSSTFWSLVDPAFLTDTALNSPFFPRYKIWMYLISSLDSLFLADIKKWKNSRKVFALLFFIFVMSFIYCIRNLLILKSAKHNIQLPTKEIFFQFYTNKIRKEFSLDLLLIRMISFGNLYIKADCIQMTELLCCMLVLS